MLVANRDDSDDGLLNQELEFGVGIVNVRLVDTLYKCFSCIGSLQAAGSVDLEETEYRSAGFAKTVVIDVLCRGT